MCFDLTMVRHDTRRCHGAIIDQVTHGLYSSAATGAIEKAAQAVNKELSGKTQGGSARQPMPKKTPVAQSDGHAPRSKIEVDAFRAFWPVDTPERLAFEVIFWTGARISDAVRLGHGNMDREGWVLFRQQQTGGEVAIPFDRALPDFAEGMEDDLACLHAALNARKDKHMKSIITAHGRSRSVKAAGRRFAAKARAAGIFGRSAHELGAPGRLQKQAAQRFRSAHGWGMKACQRLSATSAISTSASHSPARNRNKKLQNPRQKG